MATRIKSIFTPNQIYFITFTIHGWKHIFTNQESIAPMFKWFDYQQHKYNNKIHGYVIMPNHFHGLIFISDKSPPLHKLIQNAKRFLAYEIVKTLKQNKQEELLEFFALNSRKTQNAHHKIFEDRYDSKIIEHQNLFQQKLNYIHHNPLQDHWKLSNLPENYPYSSASNYILGEGVYEKVDTSVC